MRNIAEDLRFYLWRTSLDIRGTREGDYLFEVSKLLETARDTFHRCKLNGPTKTAWRKIRDCERTFDMKYSVLMEGTKNPVWPSLAPLIGDVLKYLTYRAEKMLEEEECPRRSTAKDASELSPVPFTRPLPGGYCASGAIAPSCGSTPSAPAGTQRKRGS